MSKGTPDIPAIKARLAYLGITQERLALALGLERSALTRYLRGARPMPEGLEASIHAKLDHMEASEKAAQEARERVLAELEEEG